MALRTFLHCESCHQIVGEACVNDLGEDCIKISIKVRSDERRVYVVSAVHSVTCRCGHAGPPLPAALPVEDKPASNKKPDTKSYA